MNIRYIKIKNVLKLLISILSIMCFSISNNKDDIYKISRLVRILEESVSTDNPLSNYVVMFNPRSILPLKSFPVNEWESKLNSKCECYKHIFGNFPSVIQNALIDNLSTNDRTCKYTGKNLLQINEVKESLNVLSKNIVDFSNYIFNYYINLSSTFLSNSKFIEYLLNDNNLSEEDKYVLKIINIDKIELEKLKSEVLSNLSNLSFNFSKLSKYLTNYIVHNLSNIHLNYYDLCSLKINQIPNAESHKTKLNELELIEENIRYSRYILIKNSLYISNRMFYSIKGNQLKYGIDSSELVYFQIKRDIEKNTYKINASNKEYSKICSSESNKFISKICMYYLNLLYDLKIYLKSNEGKNRIINTFYLATIIKEKYGYSKDLLVNFIALNEEGTYDIKNENLNNIKSNYTITKLENIIQPPSKMINLNENEETQTSAEQELKNKIDSIMNQETIDNVYKLDYKNRQLCSNNETNNFVIEKLDYFEKIYLNIPKENLEKAAFNIQAIMIDYAAILVKLDCTNTYTFYNGPSTQKLIYLLNQSGANINRLLNEISNEEKEKNYLNNIEYINTLFCVGPKRLLINFVISDLTNSIYESFDNNDNILLLFNSIKMYNTKYKNIVLANEFLSLMDDLTLVPHMITSSEERYYEYSDEYEKLFSEKNIVRKNDRIEKVVYKISFKIYMIVATVNVLDKSISVLYLSNGIRFDLYSQIADDLCRCTSKASSCQCVNAPNKIYSKLLNNSCSAKNYQLSNTEFVCDKTNNFNYELYEQGVKYPDLNFDIFTNKRCWSRFSNNGLLAKDIKSRFLQDNNTVVYKNELYNLKEAGLDNDIYYNVGGSNPTIAISNEQALSLVTETNNYKVQLINIDFVITGNTKISIGSNTDTETNNNDKNSNDISSSSTIELLNNNLNSNGNISVSKSTANNNNILNKNSDVITISQQNLEDNNVDKTNENNYYLNENKSSNGSILIISITLIVVTFVLLLV